jgi:hypothetical protein
MELGSPAPSSWERLFWKSSFAAACINLIDAASILVPSVFGWLNIAHHGRSHAMSVLVQALFWTLIGLSVRGRCKASQ